METHKQLRKDLTNSLRFILSTTFQVNMDMTNGHQIKIRFPPLEVMRYRFSKEDIIEYFIDAVQPTHKEITKEDVAGVVAEHLNEQMDVIEESLRLVVERCDTLVVQMRDKKPAAALQTIALILGALQPYKEITMASKICNVLEGAMLATDEME